MSTEMPAVIPLRWDATQRDVCAILTADTVSFIARDILEALGHDPGALAGEPGHPWAEDGAPTLRDHAAGTRWSRQQVGDVLAPMGDEPTRQFLAWLDANIAEFHAWGLANLARVATVGPRPKQPTVEDTTSGEAVRAEPRMPEFYSVAAVAKILDRDPSIHIGRDSLFEWLHKHGWIDRVGATWKPVRDAVFIGYLIVVDNRIPNQRDLYPQVCITPLGVEALHQRLGGTAALTLTPRDHLTLMEA